MNPNRHISLWISGTYIIKKKYANNILFEIHLKDTYSLGIKYCSAPHGGIIEKDDQSSSRVLQARTTIYQDNMNFYFT